MCYQQWVISLSIVESFEQNKSLNKQTKTDEAAAETFVQSGTFIFPAGSVGPYSCGTRKTSSWLTMRNRGPFRLLWTRLRVFWWTTWCRSPAMTSSSSTSTCWTVRAPLGCFLPAWEGSGFFDREESARCQSAVTSPSPLFSNSVLFRGSKLQLLVDGEREGPKGDFFFCFKIKGFKGCFRLSITRSCCQFVYVSPLPSAVDFHDYT